jgi:spore maturation protein CgeB
MRIFTAIRHSHDPRHFYGGLWSNNFYPALQKLGHEIIESQVDLLPASRFMQIPCKFTPQEQELRAQITQKIVDEVRQAHKQQPIDLFLSYFYNAHFDPAGFEEIHQLGIPTINFYCNSIYQFELVAAIAAKAAFSWHPERDAKDQYLRVGANPIWVQMGADPQVYYPLPHLQRQSKACFVGQRYANRDRLLASLITNGVPLALYGKGWGKETFIDSATSPSEVVTEYLGRRFPTPGSLKSYLQMVLMNFKDGGVIPGIRRTIYQFHYRSQSRQLHSLFAPIACGFADNLAETFAQYEVVLNFSNVWADGRPGSKLIPHIRLRDFEAPMCRTCYLTSYTDEIAEFYELGKEIDTYQCPEELVDKTKFYLNHPMDAENLRESGYRRALRDHTWQKRFSELFQKIGVASK